MLVILAAYLAGVYLHWGLFYAYWQRKFPLTAAEEARDDAAVSLFFALLAPFWLFGWLVTGFYQYGWLSPLNSFARQK